MEEFFPIIFVIITIVGSIIGAFKGQEQKAKRAKTSQTNGIPRATPKPIQQQKQGVGLERAPLKPTIEPKVAHSHPSQTPFVEQVEPIVGSLGNVDDEGCSHLANKRYLSIDDNNDADEEGFDYDKITAAIIYGSILSEPKSKEY